MTSYLDTALAAERFIATCRVDTDRGVAWRRTPTSTSEPLRTLYHGSAGVALCYLELHQATGDDGFLHTAVAAGDDILALIRGADWITVGIYSGWPGYAFVLNEIAKASGEHRFRFGAREAIQRMAAQSQRAGRGIGWVEPMPFSQITGHTGERELVDLSVGAAGAGLGFLYAHRQDLEEGALGWAVETAERLLEIGDTSDAGTNWPMMVDMPWQFTAPNFSHGAAGVGYFFAELHRATDNPRYLDAALDAAEFVDAHAAPSGDGHLVCHTAEHPELRYLGVCHGPPGTGRFLHSLDRINGDTSWSARLRDQLTGLLATGAPETRSDGLWQNHGQCCGDAGIGDYALWMYRATGDATFLDVARRCADVIVEAADVDDSIDDTIGGETASWLQAEHRTRPDLLERQTGYMQGAAGIASFLLHLDTIDQPRPSKIATLDTPF